jgi:hypothetical protein
MKCDREQQVIEATRNGLWTSSLRDHLRHCALCTQTELIAASLRGDAVKAERLLDLPPAGMVWRRAQATRRERAVQRAARRPLACLARYTPWFSCCGGYSRYRSPSTGCSSRLPD